MNKVKKSNYKCQCIIHHMSHESTEQKTSTHLTREGWIILGFASILIGIGLAVIFSSRFQQLKKGEKIEQIRYDIPTQDRPVIK